MNSALGNEADNDSAKRNHLCPQKGCTLRATKLSSSKTFLVDKQAKFGEDRDLKTLQINSSVLLALALGRTSNRLPEEAGCI